MYAICNPNTFTDALGLNPDLERLGDTADKLNTAKDVVKGAQQINRGKNKLKSLSETEGDIYACLNQVTTCSTTGDQMQENFEKSRRTALEGYKDIANGSVNIYQNTPGTIGNGPPSIK
nr:hypothetical protein [Comamonas sp.]